MGGAEFRAGQPRPFGQVNLAPDFGAGGNSSGAGRGEPTEHGKGIPPEIITLGQEFQMFNPQNTRRFRLPEALTSHTTYYSFKILKTNFAPPIPLIVSASDWVDNGSNSKVFLTPLNPDIGHRVTTKDFTLPSRMAQYLQAPDFQSSEEHIKAPLGFDVRSVDEAIASYDFYYPDREVITTDEYLVSLSRDFGEWFDSTPGSRELMRSFYFKLRSPYMTLVSHPENNQLEVYSMMLWFESFFPTDTGVLPYDIEEMARLGLLGEFGGGYNVKFPDDLDPLSLLKGSFNQLLSVPESTPQLAQETKSIDVSASVTHARRRSKAS